jgi:hypothetical protein
MSVFVPQTVVQRFVYSLLAADVTITSAIGGANRIYPNVSPGDIGRVKHMTHGFAGPEGGIRAEPLGQALSQITLRWDVTAWEPSFSQQALEPVMEAVQTALIGADGRGRLHRYVDGGDVFDLAVEYGGPVLVPLELQPAGVWAPISERYEIALRKAA